MMDEVETEDESQQEPAVDVTDSEDDVVAEENVDSKDIERQQRVEEAAESFYLAMKRLKADEQAESIVPEVLDDPEPIEEVVLYRDRMHWIQFFSILFPVFVIILLYPILLIMFSIIQSMAESLLPSAKIVEMLFPLVPTIIAAVILFITLKQNGFQIISDWIAWRHTRLSITNFRVVYTVNVPGWLWNLIAKIEDVEESLIRSSVINPQIKQTWLGEILGYATVTFESPAERDITFRNMRYIRRPNQIKALFNL